MRLSVADELRGPAMPSLTATQYGLLALYAAVDEPVPLGWIERSGL